MRPPARFFFFVVLPLCRRLGAESRRAESPNFIVFSEESEPAARAGHHARKFRPAAADLTSVDDPPAPNKLHVYIVSGADELRDPAGAAVHRRLLYGEPLRHCRGRRPAGGRDGPGRGARARPRRSCSTNIRASFHDASVEPAAYSAITWYVEGFAEYFATAAFGGRSIDIGNFSPGGPIRSSRASGCRSSESCSARPTVSAASRCRNSTPRAGCWCIICYRLPSVRPRSAAILSPLAKATRTAQVERATGLDREGSTKSCAATSAAARSAIAGSTSTRTGTAGSLSHPASGRGETS